MRRPLLALALAATTGIAAAQDPRPATPAPVTASADEAPKRECRTQAMTGSIMPYKRICRTKAQWRTVDAASASEVAQYSNRPQALPRDGNDPALQP